MATKDPSLPRTNTLYICPSSGLGGAETLLKDLQKYKTPSVCNTFLLFSPGPLGEELRKLKANTIILPFPVRLSRPFTFWKFFIFLSKLIRKQNIHLVHSTMAYGALFAALPAWFQGVPHLWFQHGPANGWMDQWAALLPHKVLLTNSKYMTLRQQSIENKLFLPPKKRPIQIIPLGTHQVSWSPAYRENCRKKHPKTSSDNLTIAMICRLQPEKGPHVFVAAVGLLVKKFPKLKVKGCIWGPDHGQEKYIASLKVECHNNSWPIDFLGPTRRPQECLAGCDILVNASTYPEAFGLTLIEAMAVGTIPVGPDEGGPSEIIIPDKTGLLFKPRDPHSLAHALETLIDPSTRETMQKQIFKIFPTTFDIQNTVDSIEKAHVSLLDMPEVSVS